MGVQTSSLFDRIRIDGNPVANPDSVIVCGHARFTLLTARLIRMEWSTTGAFEDRATYAFPNRYAERPEFSSTVQGGNAEIRTEAFILRYTEDGQPFSAGNLNIQLAGGQRWVPGMPNPGDLRGSRRTVDQCAGAAPLSDGLLSRDGWTLVDDSGLPRWDVDQTWLEARPESHLQDWYFFAYGHDYKAALKDYVRFGGPIPLVPRYVLGTWWSRFWAYRDEDLKQLVNDFAKNDVPLDVLVVDMDWHTTDGWTGYTWNRELFPDPEGFLAWVHAQGVFSTFNLHPAMGVQHYEAAYPEFARRMGIDPSTREGVRFNATDKAFVQHYFELLHHPMEEQGVDFWWVDWQQGESTDIKNLDPLPWLNHLHFRDSMRRGKRSMLYSRWGGLGNHRYPIGFSGDSFATWDALRFQPYYTATAANVGYGWWSHDIGGHFGATEPELYARWVQFGAVSPCLRLHSTKDPLAERRPWAMPPDVYEAAKAAIQFRYRLLPYLYSAARAASEQGLSLCYPMYYEAPEAEDAYLARDQYFLGEQVIAAPITRPADPKTHLATVDVWLPEGSWVDYNTLKSYMGPRWIRTYGDLNCIPLFVKAGAILPMAKDLKRTRNFDGSEIVLELFPGADGAFTLYEDDGLTDAYQRGEYETTRISTIRKADGAVVITIDPAEGRCPTLPARRSFEMHLRGVTRPETIQVNGVKQPDWTYARSEAVIAIKNADRRGGIEVRITGIEPASAPAVCEPFIHVVDYDLFQDTRNHLGALVIVPTADDEPYDVDIEWTLHRRGIIISAPMTLRNRTGRQIVYCPFADDGSSTSFRWSVSATATHGEIQYQSRDAYPSLNHWQSIVYNRDEQPLSIDKVCLQNGKINPDLPWQQVPTPSLLNLYQPFGMVFLEQERQRIQAGEPLEACVSTTLSVMVEQDGMLYVQSVGEHTAYLNGRKLTPNVAATPPMNLDPMFVSWMPPRTAGYAITLPKGENSLVIFSRPDTSLGWWGVGATLFDASGAIAVNYTSEKA